MGGSTMKTSVSTLFKKARELLLTILLSMLFFCRGAIAVTIAPTDIGFDWRIGIDVPSGNQGFTEKIGSRSSQSTVNQSLSGDKLFDIVRPFGGQTAPKKTPISQTATVVGDLSQGTIGASAGILNEPHIQGSIANLSRGVANITLSERLFFDLTSYSIGSSHQVEFSTLLNGTINAPNTGVGYSFNATNLSGGDQLNISYGNSDGRHFIDRQSGNWLETGPRIFKGYLSLVGGTINDVDLRAGISVNGNANFANTAHLGIKSVFSYTSASGIFLSGLTDPTVTPPITPTSVVTAVPIPPTFPMVMLGVSMLAFGWVHKMFLEFVHRLSTSLRKVSLERKNVRYYPLLFLTAGCGAGIDEFLNLPPMSKETLKPGYLTNGFTADQPSYSFATLGNKTHTPSRLFVNYDATGKKMFADVVFANDRGNVFTRSYAISQADSKSLPGQTKLVFENELPPGAPADNSGVVNAGVAHVGQYGFAGFLGDAIPNYSFGTRAPKYRINSAPFVGYAGGQATDPISIIGSPSASYTTYGSGLVYTTAYQTDGVNGLGTITSFINAELLGDMQVDFSNGSYNHVIGVSAVQEFANSIPSTPHKFTILTQGSVIGNTFQASNQSSTTSAAEWGGFTGPEAAEVAGMINYNYMNDDNFNSTLHGAFVGGKN